MASTTNASVRRAYARLAGVYDLIFGAILQPGRAQAVASVRSRPGLRVLELGIGTGLTAPLYSPQWNVVGVDLSEAMLKRARQRILKLRGHDSVRLVEADGARLPFTDESFDVALVPYVLSVVPDPIGVARELHRICRPSGQIIILNHFLSRDPVGATVERLLCPLTSRLGGFHTDLPLHSLLRGAGLSGCEVREVNVPPIWKLVTCVKPSIASGEAV